MKESAIHNIVLFFIVYVFPESSHFSEPLLAHKRSQCSLIDLNLARIESLFKLFMLKNGFIRLSSLSLILLATNGPKRETLLLFHTLFHLFFACLLPYIITCTKMICPYPYSRHSIFPLDLLGSWLVFVHSSGSLEMVNTFFIAN